MIHSALFPSGRWCFIPLRHSAGFLPPAYQIMIQLTIRRFR